MVLGDIETLKVVSLEIGLSRAGLPSGKRESRWEGVVGRMLWDCTPALMLGHESAVPVPGQQV